MSPLTAWRRRARAGRTERSDRGFSLVEVLVSVVLLGVAGVSVLGAAAAAARGSSTHRRVADVQVVAAAAADAVMGLRPVPCTEEARSAYREAIGVRLAAVDVGGAGVGEVRIADVREWNTATDSFQVCQTTNPDLLTPQLLTLEVTSADGTTSRSVYAMTGTLPPTVDIGDPLAYAESSFAIVSFGDTSMDGNFHVWGGAAIGGDLRFTGGAEVGHNDGGTFVVPDEAPHVTALVVDGTIDFANSTGALTVLSGWFHAGSLPAQSTSVSGTIVTVRPAGAQSSIVINGNDDSQSSAAANIEWPNLFDFAGAFDAFGKASVALGRLPGQCIDAVAARFVDAHDVPATSGNAFWSITPGKVNVLTTTAAQLASMGNINTGGANASHDTPLIINVTDADVVLTQGSITQNWPQYVIWNFPNATSVRVEGLLGGSLYAPFADVTVSGEIRGAAVAKTLAGGNEVKWNNFRPDIRDIDCAREP